VFTTYATDHRVSRFFGVPSERIANLGGQPMTVFDDGQG
jgi:hypothetical protein